MPDFDKLAEYIDTLSRDFDIPASSCAAALEGEVVWSHCSGFSDEARTRPASMRDTYWLYSATKLFTCAALLRLVERGLLSLEDPVSKYLPEYARLTVREGDSLRPARGPMLIRHLFTMTSGLDYDLQRPALKNALSRPGELTTRSLARALAQDPLRFDPGEHFLYSLSHDVLAAVAEVITGQRFSEYLNDSIIRPLGMVDVTFHPTLEQLSRLSAQYAHDYRTPRATPIGQKNTFNICDGWESGGGGLLGTVEDYIRLPAALANGGRAGNGWQVLLPETIRAMSAPRLSRVPLEDFRRRSPADLAHSYGLGVRVLTDPGRSTGSPGQFGWDGAAGAFVIVDPAHRAALFYAQHVCTSYVTYQQIHPTLRRLFAEALNNK